MTLRPFKPGESGNPGGRKKKPMVAKMLEDILTANDSAKAKQIAERLVSLATTKGSIQAAKIIIEHTDGKAMRNATDPEKGDAKMTNEQINARLAELFAIPELKERLAALFSVQEQVH
jgi:hypothetical protein